MHLCLFFVCNFAAAFFVTIFCFVLRSSVDQSYTFVSGCQSTLLFFINSLNLYFIVSLLQFFIAKIEADWSSPDSGQYHIQTDEGDERFFRYQTDSGQFRNEKRLKDGTVIGRMFPAKFSFTIFFLKRVHFFRNGSMD